MTSSSSRHQRARAGWLKRHRIEIATATVAAVGVASLLVYAAISNGNPPHHAQLNDGGVWVTTGSNQASSFGAAYGQINAQTNQYSASILPKTRIAHSMFCRTVPQSWGGTSPGN